MLRLILLIAACLAVSACGPNEDSSPAPGHKWDAFYCTASNQSYPCRMQRSGR